jgi:hypothetical protein
MRPQAKRAENSSGMHATKTRDPSKQLDNVLMRNATVVFSDITFNYGRCGYMCRDCDANGELGVEGDLGRHAREGRSWERHVRRVQVFDTELSEKSIKPVKCVLKEMD